MNEHGIATFGHEDIAALAHALWQARGCPEGSPEEDWFQAAQELRARSEGLPEVNAHQKGSESMKRSYLSSFPMRAVFCAALLLALGGALLSAQQPPQLPPPGQALAPGQLDDLVAPIALYPDPLVSQILVASTYPLELVQASQWLQRNPGSRALP